jgi:hypothetical protein
MRLVCCMGNPPEGGFFDMPCSIYNKSSKRKLGFYSRFVQIDDKLYNVLII